MKKATTKPKTTKKAAEKPGRSMEERVKEAELIRYCKEHGHKESNAFWVQTDGQSVYIIRQCPRCGRETWRHSGTRKKAKEKAIFDFFIEESELIPEVRLYMNVQRARAATIRQKYPPVRKEPLKGIL